MIKIPRDRHLHFLSFQPFHLLKIHILQFLCNTNFWQNKIEKRICLFLLLFYCFVDVLFFLTRKRKWINNFCFNSEKMLFTLRKSKLLFYETIEMKVHKSEDPHCTKYALTIFFSFTLTKQLNAISIKCFSRADVRWRSLKSQK